MEIPKTEKNRPKQRKNGNNKNNKNMYCIAAMYCIAKFNHCSQGQYTLHARTRVRRCVAPYNDTAK